MTKQQRKTKTPVASVPTGNGTEPDDHGDDECVLSELLDEAMDLWMESEDGCLPCAVEQALHNSTCGDEHAELEAARLGRLAMARLVRVRLEA